MASILFYCALFLLFFSFSLQQSNADYNVIRFGAKPDGKTDSTEAFVRAWSSACRSTGPATVSVPRGGFLIKPIVFSGPCKNEILFRIDGKIVAPADYWSFGKSGFWILFYKVSRVTIHGGTIDAKGAGFWACRKAGMVCPPGARSMSFLGSNDIVVSGLTSINSQMFHISVDQSHNIILQNLNILAPSLSPNTDGVHVQSSTGITIRNSTIRTGDDCISLGPGSKNIWIQTIACGPGHGISIGSLAEHTNEDGVENVTVTGAIFTATQNGVRIKSWGRPTTGYAKNIVFQNIIMKNAYNPIIIDQKYCPSGHGCPNQDSGVKISGVAYKNINGTSASKVAINFVCSSSTPCKGLKLQNIELTYLSKGAAMSSCNNANGSTSGLVIPRSCF
ncbi:Polygalacturonase precursor, putative [Ricinus communis]|uniref:Polygalacturonase, putative n=1 Tax=Ricinus communis TaxID=3988 RepID=B9SSX5_RICCO|nr:Polygalacturonase precursor, putative [Ricinus communis]|eukprot:XP_002529094.1 polygalacturonase [Ricinus communis]